MGVMLLQRQYFSIDIERKLSHHLLFLGACFQSVFCFNDPSNPRLTLHQDHTRLLYGRNYSRSVFLLHEESESLFIGGPNVLLHFDINRRKILENYTLNLTLPRDCNKSSCENVVTVIEQFQDCTLVCGTNGEHPKCWKLYCREGNHSNEVIEDTGISPHKCTQNSLSLIADGDLYAAAPLYSDGTLLQFRRTAGKRCSLWMHDQWVTEPTFISSFLAQRIDDPMNEKIYVLFREKNADRSPEADPWISRVARVCKVDEGGPKQYLQNIWTSFLKARLVCGIPKESLYFNRLQDVFVQHAENWKDSRVYALFSSSWNSTAVCIYSLEELDGVFESSSFKSFDQEIPHPRPGTCVKDSKSIPPLTLNIIKDHPEMRDWIHPIQKDTPFFTSNNNYTKIVVDKVQASDGTMHNVLLLAKDSGVILKILEADTKAFIISETHLCNGSAPIQSMKLDSKKKNLFVGYPNQMCVLDLQRCQDYKPSCPDCVLSRDPYCAWTERGCTSQTKQGIQNIANGNTYVCPQKTVVRIRRDLQSSSTNKSQYYVPNGSPFYLSCPVDSHHAIYWWEHNGKNRSCQQTQSECILLIPKMTSEMYGDFTCKAHERDYTRIVMEYDLASKAMFDNGVHLRVLATFLTIHFLQCLV